MKKTRKLTFLTLVLKIHNTPKIVAEKLAYMEYYAYLCIVELRELLTD